jgi:hypothetical protein
MKIAVFSKLPPSLLCQVRINVLNTIKYKKTELKISNTISNYKKKLHLLRPFSDWRSNRCLKYYTILVAWVRERTIPTERPPLVGELSTNFFGYRVPCSQREGSLLPYSWLSRQKLTSQIVKLKETSIIYWNVYIRNLDILPSLSAVSGHFSSHWETNMIMTLLRLHQKTRWKSEIMSLRINEHIIQMQPSNLAASKITGLCFRIIVIVCVCMWERERERERETVCGWVREWGGREVAVWISNCYKGTHPLLKALLFKCYIQTKPCKIYQRCFTTFSTLS